MTTANSSNTKQRGIIGTSAAVYVRVDMCGCVCMWLCASVCVGVCVWLCVRGYVWVYACVVMCSVRICEYEYV